MCNHVLELGLSVPHCPSVYYKGTDSAATIFPAKYSRYQPLLNKNVCIMSSLI